jgi:hypothetical protein
MIVTMTGDLYHGKCRNQSGGWGWHRRARDRGDIEFTGSRKLCRLVPNLLAVNKLIREEGSSVLYKQEITLEDTTALLHFITTIGGYNRQVVSDLVVKGWGQGMFVRILARPSDR